MSEQKQIHPPIEQAGPDAGTDSPAERTRRLAAARAERDALVLATDAIMSRLDEQDSSRFLEQVRQTGGQ